METVANKNEITYTLADGQIVKAERNYHIGVTVTLYANAEAVEAEEPLEQSEYRTAEELMEALGMIGTIPAEVEKLLRTYSVGDGQGGDSDYEADSICEALENAGDWADGGDWGEGKCIITVAARDWCGESESKSVTVGDDEPEPDCMEDMEHDWQAPYEIVGGCRENPGVWSLGGTRISSKEVCANCGKIKNYKSESTPGQYPQEPDETTYEDATEATEAWAESRRSE